MSVPSIRISVAQVLSVVRVTFSTNGSPFFTVTGVGSKPSSVTFSSITRSATGGAALISAAGGAGAGLTAVGSLLQPAANTNVAKAIERNVVTGGTSGAVVTRRRDPRI